MSRSVKLVISKMSKTLKITLWSLLIVLLVGGAGYLVGRGAGGANIEQSIPFSIQVNPSGSFTLVIDPSDVTVTKGDPLVFSISATPTGGFDALIELTVAGLPEGSYSFSSVTMSQATGYVSSLTVNTSMLQSNTGYSCTLTGVDK